MRHQQNAAAWIFPSAEKVFADRARQRGLSLQLELMLASGGDERVWPDPATGRNRYGTPVGPAAHEIWFSSSTASAPSLAAYRAAAEVLAALTGTPGLPVHEWFDAIRARILRSFGIPGAAAILTASGTEAELMTLAVARALLKGPLTNLLIAPHETGSGVPQAAAGRHFLGSAPHLDVVERGLPVDATLAADVELLTVSLRDADGRRRSGGAVDSEVLALAAARHDSLLLHMLDTSKTGLSGPSPTVVREIRDTAPDKVLVAVDACQLRCTAAEIKAYLQNGFMVLLTGSKFLGGAPFCGCLLLPPAIADALAEAPPASAGLAAYSACLDVPLRLRDWFAHGFGGLANIGLGLRWTTALAELDRFEAHDESLRNQILTAFIDEVRSRADAVDWLRAEPPYSENDPNRGGIITLVMGGSERGATAMRRAAILHTRLREPYPELAGDAICHIGQPVAIGEKAALRICASAPLINGVAERLSAGLPFQTAFAPVTRDLDTLFQKWATIVAEDEIEAPTAA
jgi:hypothetical protein